LAVLEHPAPQQIEVLDSMQAFVAETMPLVPIDESWQPSDFLPDLRGEDWAEQLRAFRGPANELSDEILVVLVADMVTEEALPSYSVSLNLLARDTEGASPAPWARWNRGWTAEENRHGDLLNAYLRLSGRVNMRSVETTIHHLLTSGFEPRAYPDLYGGLVYTAFQERATKISHANVGRLAGAAGDATLQRICQKIAADEARHESFYTKMMGRVFELDPEGALNTCRTLLRRVIAMPGRKMYDGQDPDLFEHFSAVAQRLGVYTVTEYAEIIEHLVKTWHIASLSVSGKAARAQEYLCGLGAQYRKLAESVGQTLANAEKVPFSWIEGRSV
jgi:acyl-[acyl-carrier-protein] desaturase